MKWLLYIRTPLTVLLGIAITLLRLTGRKWKKSRGMKRRDITISTYQQTTHRLSEYDYLGKKSPESIKYSRRVKLDIDTYSTFYPRLLLWLGGCWDFELYRISRSTHGKWHLFFISPFYLNQGEQIIIRFLMLDDMWRTFLDTRRDAFNRSVLFDKKNIRYMPDGLSI